MSACLSRFLLTLAALLLGSCMHSPPAPAAASGWMTDEERVAAFRALDRETEESCLSGHPKPHPTLRCFGWHRGGTVVDAPPSMLPELELPGAFYAPASACDSRDIERPWLGVTAKQCLYVLEVPSPMQGDRAQVIATLRRSSIDVAPFVYRLDFHRVGGAWRVDSVSQEQGF